MLPLHVSVMPALYASLSAALAVLFYGGKIVREDRVAHAATADVLLRYRWAAILVAVLAAAVVTQSVVQEKVFQMMQLKANRQHFVNLHWIRQYRTSLMT